MAAVAKKIVTLYIKRPTGYRSNELVVCHCYREQEKTIRIISARKANRGEAAAYWENHT
jgi:uncharacterized DUF497 family protein